MIILNLIPSLSGGGAEQQLSYLAPELVSYGHSVHIAYLYEGPKRTQIQPSAIQFHKLTAINNYDPSIVWQLIRLIRQIKPDIIHTWIMQMDILGCIAAKITKTPWILREPSSGIRYFSTWKFALRNFCASFADGIISNSIAGNQFWQQKCPNVYRSIVRNGLPLVQIQNVQNALPDMFGLDTQQHYLLYVGRFEHGKNLEYMIKAMSVVMAEFPISVVLCGDGSLRHTLQEQVSTLGLSKRVIFTGVVANEVVWSLMKGADALVFMSEYEGLPNVVIEAMACGCPLVVSDIPAHREILDDDSALIVDHYDPSKIVQAIMHVLNHSELSQKRALNALAKVDTFSIAAMARSYEEIYSSIIP